jgi:hypothetical protein
MIIELLACPFCGGEAELVDHPVFCGEKHVVVCKDCLAECICVESWNRREHL